MNRVNALLGITVLAVLAGCAKKEAPQAQDDDVSVAAQPGGAAAQPEATIDRSKAAASMVIFIDPSPQCQQYREELEAKGRTPGPVDELNEIFVQASKAGCKKKKQSEEAPAKETD
jgi:hypothetical protein